MRLNRFVAAATGISRRGADILIAEGKVIINGKVAQLGDQASSEDLITIDGHAAALSERRTYLVLNKPTGYVTSRRQQGTAPTVYSLLPQEFFNLKPVGRLDRDTSGILLLTDDGNLAHTMTHPSYSKQKTYDVSVDRPLSDKDLIKLRQGVVLDDGLSRFDSIEGQGKKWKIRLHEGRNRQIRRTFAAIGAKVITLHRDSFGPLNLKNISPGEFKLIALEDIL